MKKNDKEHLRKVSTWVEYADEGLRIAEIALTISSNVPYRIISFHSQQSAEKYIKAFLVFHSIDFPYTHNISTLTELAEPIIDLKKRLKIAKKLSKYAVAVRYPNEYLKIKKNEAIKTIKTAIMVKKVIR